VKTWTVFILPWAGTAVRALPHAGAPAIESAVFLGIAPSAVGFVLWAYAMSRRRLLRHDTRPPQQSWWCVRRVPSPALSGVNAW
jgi:hypothetical protein